MAQVLIVDDSSTVRNEVGDFLKKNGLTVDLASASGRRSSGERSRPVRVPSTCRNRNSTKIATPMAMRVGISRKSSIGSVSLLPR